MMRVLITSALALGLLAGCAQVKSLTQTSNRVSFDGNYYRAKAKKVDDNRAVFSVRVPVRGKSLTGAREAGRYEGTKYCIQNYGSSRIDWIAGPDDDDSRLTLQDDSLILQGECKV